MTAANNRKVENDIPTVENDVVLSEADAPELGTGSREALLALGRLTGYVAPLTVALMSDKARAFSF
jgi:hypothetical protein